MRREKRRGRGGEERRVRRGKKGRKEEEEGKNKALKAVGEAQGQIQVGTSKGAGVLSFVENGEWRSQL